MKISIGSDHRGFKLKADVIELLKKLGHDVFDTGTFNENSCDYPPIAYEVALKVSKHEVDRGLLICMSGIGMTIAANKVNGVRAALCHNLRSAELSRQHNDANLLTLSPAQVQDPLEKILELWLSTDFEGGRHKRRVDQIAEIEQKEKHR